MEDEEVSESFNIEEFIENEVELALKRDPEVLAHLMRFYDGTYTAHQLGELLGSHIDKTEDDMRIEMKESINEKRARDSEFN